ncbi:TPA: hypothetical protein ACH3X1_012485 [Trebouxia sp. C0004]
MLIKPQVAWLMANHICLCLSNACPSLQDFNETLAVIQCQFIAQRNICMDMHDMSNFFQTKAKHVMRSRCETCMTAWFSTWSIALNFSCGSAPMTLSCKSPYFLL